MTQHRGGRCRYDTPPTRWGFSVATAALCIVLALLPARAVAQAADTASRRSQATVQGAVFDSLNNVPLRGAVVQLVGVDRTARFARAMVADDSGRFAFERVPDGVYALGFFGSLLDSLGFEPVLQAVRLQGDSMVRADLSGPSAWQLQGLLCSENALDDETLRDRGDTTDNNSSSNVSSNVSSDNSSNLQARGLVLGRVRNALSLLPSTGATVRANWFEVSVEADGIRTGARSRAVTVGTSGWYALCDVSAAGSMLLGAANDGDSTDVIPVEMLASGLLRRDLYVGRAGVSRMDSLVEADTNSLELLPKRIGPGRLTGLVLTATGEQPLPAARASIANGVESASNANGQFTLSNIPAGTRLLDVRAVGYFPLRMPVDVVEGAPRVRVVLPSLKSVLDSVRIVAERNRSANLRGFDERRRTKVQARFLTPEDFMKRSTDFMSDILAGVPGLSLDRSRDGRDRLGMRPVLGRGRCAPNVFIDGAELRGLSTEDLNAFARKGDVQGIEVYPSGTVPVEFSRFDTAGMFGCGAIVIWTK